MPTNAAVALPIRKVNRSSELQAPASPFLKWVGSKAKLERAFAPLYPPGVALMRHGDEVEVVLRHLQQLAKLHGEEGYYHARERYNARDHTSRAERAALFIYLNK